MGYTMLRNSADRMIVDRFSLKGAVLTFVRENCEGLRFDKEKAAGEDAEKGVFFGTSLKENEIPYNMQMDLDRLCLENALARFLDSGSKEDAFDVYFCYLEMFVGDYEKTRRMIELLSEFEANGSSLLMKHRDHYSHSVYVFALGLAIYQSNEIYRREYCLHYGFEDSHEAACHYLEFWGLASLFHDIGYPFELPFEQVESYFEVAGDKRAERPFVSYSRLAPITFIGEKVKESLAAIYGGRVFDDTNELFAYILAQKLGNTYSFTEEKMHSVLKKKPIHPEEFGHFMDHAYFSATVLFHKLFDEMKCELKAEHLDALTAILIHNSLYKFDIAQYKEANNIPFKIHFHPLAYMLMLCDELQCWDRTAYGRNSRKELHPLGCRFDFSGNSIDAEYLFDKKEIAKIRNFEEAYGNWVVDRQGREPQLKAYSRMYIKNEDGISGFQEDIERIVDLTDIRLSVQTDLTENIHHGSRSCLSQSNFINLYHFAAALNGRWSAVTDEKELLDSFRRLSLEYKLSNINQAKAFAVYMNEIGCFYTDKDVDFEMVEKFSSDELLAIGVLEHKRWLQEHWNMGWEYGNPDKKERELLRQHKDMIPGLDPNQPEITPEQARINYERLDKAEQDKDTAPMECMLTLLRMYDGLRIYRLK